MSDNGSPGKDVTLVWIPGWGFTSHIFEAFCHTHASQYTNVLLDWPAPSLTSALPTFDLTQLVAAMVEEIPKPCVLVGWSYGGMIACEMAKMAPKDIVGIFGIGTTPKFINQQGWPGISPEGFAMLYNLIEQNTPMGLRYFTKLLQDTPLTNDYLNLITDSLLPSANVYTPILLNHLSILGRHDGRPTLKSAHCPVHFIYGDQDRLVPHQVTSALMPDCYPLTMTLLEGAGHCLFLTHGEKCKDVLDEFILEVVNGSLSNQPADRYAL